MNEQHDAFRRLRVLIIGAGRRVQGNFLPVLKTLDRQFEIVGVHSRTYERLKPVADSWQVPAVQRLEDLDLGSVDVVAISVPTAQNGVVLRKLLGHAGHLSVVVDTPIAWTRPEYAENSALLARFKQAAVAEDYMNFPTFALAREAVKQGWIGEPRALTLNCTGFLYHGLALIRSFVDFEPVVRTWTRSVGDTSRMVGYRFSNGFEAVVIKPYRSHTAGGLMLEGSSGIVSEFPIDHQMGNGKRKVHLLKLLRDEGGLTGCALEGPDGTLRSQPPELVQMRAMPINTEDLNLLRGCGLATIFRSLIEADGLNSRYGVRNGFYDAFISRLVEKGRLPYDPFTLFGRTAMTALGWVSHARA